ncbi:uncharacterized protein LOC117639306 isoform X2 [Thrips palmi]|uniref:Uncharacterized protein LOC117639306 isoform X2 n=1 Tax=Thrips palmi TaxID=161013 RepID=A0A6P8YAF9_THRPL|nr:uncharacterized protein LOC117639306 isoform X2 [Thrips palmi]
MPSSTRGRGRRSAGLVDLAGLPWLAGPVPGVHRLAWPVPGLAPLTDSTTRAPAAPALALPAPLQCMHGVQRVDLWDCLDGVTEATEDDVRATSPASTDSSGYSSYGDVSSSSADSGDTWKEREVYASLKYESMGIDCTFNYWSPITEDDAVLDELSRRQVPSHLSRDQDQDQLKQATDLDIMSVADVGPTGAQEAKDARGCSEPAFLREGTAQNAPFAENDELRRAAVVASNRLDWGAAFYRWLPMPTLEEAILLARIAEAEELELRRQSALRKAAKQKKFGSRRENFSSVSSERPGRRGASTTVSLEFPEVWKNF